MSAPPTPSTLETAPPAAPANPYPRLVGGIGIVVGIVLLYFGYARPMQLATEGVERITYDPRLAGVGVSFVLGSAPWVLFGHAFSRLLGVRQTQGGGLAVRRGPLFYVFCFVIFAAGMAVMILLDQNLEAMGYRRD